jgi:hypothetical protein
VHSHNTVLSIYDYLAVVRTLAAPDLVGSDSGAAEDFRNKYVKVSSIKGLIIIFKNLYQ